MKEPQVQIRRRKRDVTPLLYLFGVEQQDGALQAEAFHATARIRAGMVGVSGGTRYRLPALQPGFQMAPLRLTHA